MSPTTPNYESPDTDLSVEEYVPSPSALDPDHSPRWLRVLVGDGGVDGQQVWVRVFADDAPHGLPTFETDAPRPGVPDAWVVSPALVFSTNPSPLILPPKAQANAPKNQGDETGWLSVETAAPRLDTSPTALRKRLYRAARRTKDGVRVNLNGVEARKLGGSWKVYIPADWRRT